MDKSLCKVIRTLVEYMASNHYQLINCMSTPRTQDSFQVHYFDVSTQKVLVISLFLRCDRVIAETMDVDTHTTVNVVNGMNTDNFMNILVM